MKTAALAVLAAGFMAPTAALATPSCEAQGEVRPYCGFRQPEDLEPLADGRHLLVSQMNLTPTPQGFLFKSGKLSLLDTRTGKVRDLYPGKSAGQAKAKPTPGWGDPACPGEIGDALSPHGIHLSRRGDGRLQLLVVNHGGREAVEFFELDGQRLTWRGCAVAPRGSTMNDVAARPGGGFIASNMIDASTPEQAAQAMDNVARGENTGFVWTWSASFGYQKLPGSDGPLPNGVQVDAAGRYAYYNVVGPQGAVRKVDLQNYRLVGSAPTPNPDNLSWDGKRLLTAGVLDHRTLSQCDSAAPCRSASHASAIDPETMQATRLFEQDGSLQRGVSVAVAMGKRLYIGAFAGDRVLSVPLK
ncbi:hypothetical protein B9N43_05120 [Denitratisoma sp. DHT3]|uniref:hypothetical protein n=1 Tax=Denitratisoma sp. DHT3 TaxID=1981880 RepID=UPI001198AF56|nr:hypothetical protein [Denitratisoma sp. DHT3]QDX80680.1 hypothetical protein B9N43_05120 [Denitratisoma sp. DHT3]